MDEAQRIWEELRRSDWVDKELDYEAVIAALADHPHGGAWEISRKHRYSARGFLRLSGDDQQLLRELTAIARAPCLAMPWPETPTVELERLVADFERTTGRQIILQLRWDNYPSGGYWACDITIDDKARGSFGVNVNDADPEDTLATTADRLCEGWLHEEVWGGWPICSLHGTHPLDAQVHQSVAVWYCPSSGVIARIGDLGLTVS